MADFADIAAAETAGYSETVTLEQSGSYLVVLEKPLVGGDGRSGFCLRAAGEGASQAAAEAVALAALNKQRQMRYGNGNTSGIPDGHEVYDGTPPPIANFLLPDIE